MKLERMMGILTLLLRREQVTAPQLAARFEVSRRTISRDLEALSAAGIPVVTASGFGGGVSLAEGYKIDHTLLTREELQAVFMGLRSLDSVSRTSHTRQLMEKLGVENSQAVQTGDVVVVDLASHYQQSLTEKIEVLKQSVLLRRLVTFVYYSEKGQSNRTVEPYLILFRWSSWYLYAYCVQRRDFRMFKLNRLWQLQDTQMSFEPRPMVQPDPDRYFDACPYHLEAVFRPSVRHRLVEEYGPESFQESPDGLHFMWDFTSYENTRQWISSFGADVQVLEPTQLREDLLDAAKKMAAFYEGT